MLPKILTINNPKSISHICLLVQIMEANIVLQKNTRKTTAKVYFKPCQTSNMELFTKAVNSF